MATRILALVRNISAIFVSASLLALSACGPDERYCGECDQCAAFLKMGGHQQSVEIAKLPKQAQVDVYVCLMSYEKPRPIHLTFQLAKEGKDILPVILEKMRILSGGGDEGPSQHLFEIITEMHEQGYYDLACDEAALKALEGSVQGMSLYRATDIEWIDKVRKGIIRPRQR
jgi:hypothetical protein